MKIVNLSIETLMGLPNYCVYGLVNEERKTIQIYSTKDLLAHLLETLKEIRISGEYLELKKDEKSISLCILETNIGSRELRIRQSYWISEYRSKGYKNYKDIAPSRYKVVVESKFDVFDLKFLVYLRNSNRDSILVAEFRTKREMKKWLDTYYKDGVVSQIVYKVSNS